jgi:amidase
MGSDIGGSIRNPAHYCGVFGHKPTWALIPNRGHALPGVLAEPDIAVVGPLARSAADLHLVLDILAKPDELEAAIRYELPSLAGRTLADLRVAVWANDDVAPVSQECEQAVRTVARACREAGARVDDEARPPFTAKEVRRNYLDLLYAFMAKDILATSAPPPLAAGVNEEFIARFATAATLTHAEWIELHEERERLRWEWHEFFRSWDVLLAPVASTPAFAHDHSDYYQRTIMVDNARRPYFDQLFWAGFAGIAHLPSTVIPATRGREGLPVGVQVIGPAYGDLITIGAARLLEDRGFTFTPPPAYT